MIMLLGACVAFFVSIQRDNSLGMILLHTLLGWFYVAYVGFKCKFIDGYKQYKEENKD